MPIVDSQLLREPTFNRLDVKTSVSRGATSSAARGEVSTRNRKSTMHHGERERVNTSSSSPSPARANDEGPPMISRDWVNTLVDHLESYGLTRHSLETSTWSALLDLERAVADKVVDNVAVRNLNDVRNLNKWLLSLLRKEADAGDGHQPGDVEDLSRRVKDAVLEEISMRRIRPEDLSARCIAVLNDLPVTSAVEVIHDFARCDHDKIHNPSGYLMGMLRRYSEGAADARGRGRERGGPPRGNGAGGRGGDRGVGGSRGGAGGGGGGVPRVSSGPFANRSVSGSLSGGFTPRDHVALSPQKMDVDRRGREDYERDRADRERSLSDRDRDRERRSSRM